MGLESEVRGGSTRFYHPDILGTTRTTSNASAAVSSTLETDAFGNTWTPGTSGTQSPFGFAGQHGYQSDADSGLMRVGYRYYDALSGRFISRDPIQDGYNWYTYCDNDPVNFVDPTGLQDVGRPALPKNSHATLAASYTFPNLISIGLGVTINDDGSIAYTISPGLGVPKGWGVSLVGGSGHATTGTSGSMSSAYGGAFSKSHNPDGTWSKEAGVGTPSLSITGNFTISHYDLFHPKIRIPKAFWYDQKGHIHWVYDKFAWE